jgi:hypothetical protein
MLRMVFVLLGFTLLPLAAQESESDGPGPLISIISPDTGGAFAFGTIKNHALVWDRKNKMLYAQITFVDTPEDDQQQTNEDTQRFRLPGVTFDEARKLFVATSPQGEQVPIARIKKQLFLSSIEVLPNAVVRIQHHREDVTVILEAVRPHDPALKPAPPKADTGDTHTVDLRQLLQ